MRVGNATNQNVVLLLCASIGATIVVNPWFSYDPINLPKMVVLAAFSSALIPIAVQILYVLFSKERILFFLFVISILALITRPFMGGGPLSQQFWGIWGRNTGMLTYISLIVLLLVSIELGRAGREELIVSWFCRTSYFISFYTLMQYGQIDPINWSQKIPIATLGNINFMSAFLGLANIVFFGKILLQRLNLSELLHFVFFLILNTVLIWQSGSIQGVAIFMAGAWLIVVFKSRKSKTLGRVSLISVPIIGILGLLGTAGRGPFGSILIQETVIFRLDYWKSGINMFLSNRSFGVGLDSYGDYYRMYRDSAAAIRTGPQRVTNTAHNVILDILTGGGLFVGIPFLLLLLFLFWKISIYGRLLIYSREYFNRSETSKVSIAIMLAVIPGWIVFLMISINQIGVAVWGFVFLGLVYGALGFDNLTVKSFSESKANRKTKRSVGIFGFVPGIVFGLLVSLPPLVADAKFLTATKARNFQDMRYAAESLGSSSFHWERLISLANEDKRFDDALQYSRQALLSNQNNFQALATLTFSPLEVQAAERKNAALKLSKLDPENSQLQNDLRNILKS